MRKIIENGQRWKIHTDELGCASPEVIQAQMLQEIANTMQQINYKMRELGPLLRKIIANTGRIPSRKRPRKK